MAVRAASGWPPVQSPPPLPSLSPSNILHVCIPVVIDDVPPTGIRASSVKRGKKLQGEEKQARGRNGMEGKK